jgi:hypothetical protein
VPDQPAAPRLGSPQQSDGPPFLVTKKWSRTHAQLARPPLTSVGFARPLSITVGSRGTRSGRLVEIAIQVFVLIGYVLPLSRTSWQLSKKQYCHVQSNARRTR